MSTVGDSLSYLPNKFQLIFLPFVRLSVKSLAICQSIAITLLNNFSVYTWQQYYCVNTLHFLSFSLR